MVCWVQEVMVSGNSENYRRLVGEKPAEISRYSQVRCRRMEAHAMLAIQKLSPDLWDGRLVALTSYQPCMTARQIVFDKVQPIPELRNRSITPKSIGSISPGMNSRKRIWLIESHRYSKSMTACRCEGGKLVYR